MFAKAINDDYALNRTRAEYERLVIQSRVWADVTERALDRIGLQPGLSALDVGCGPGAVMRAIGRRVGPAGTVTGLDIDGAMGREALGVLAAEGGARYRFVEGDLMRLGEVPGGPFDVVVARLLVFHLKDQIAALAKLWSFVKPGGSLLIMDYDLSAVRAIPAHPAADRAIELMGAGFRAAGCNIRIGTEMPALFMQAGLGEPDGIEVNGLVTSGRNGVAMLSAVLNSLAPLIVGKGLESPDCLGRVFEDLDAVALRPFARYPDMVSTWKRKSG